MKEKLLRQHFVKLGEQSLPQLIYTQLPYNHPVHTTTDYKSNRLQLKPNKNNTNYN